MKNVPWEIFTLPVSITVVGALLIWAIKSWINGLKKTITEDVEKKLDNHENRITINEQNIKQNEQTAKDARAQAEFLMKHLLERKS
jgi:phage baseplate assembly protein W